MRDNPNPAAASQVRADPATRDEPQGGGGQTTADGENQQPAPRLPHERDQSASEQAGDEASQSSVGSVGLDDLRAGRKNTDRSAETDATYNRNFDRSDEPPRP